jgi:uncharacterized protein DUF5615
VRILLDAHISGRTVGKVLAGAGHDVRALDSEAELEGLSDPEVLQLAAAEGRLLVTANVGTVDLHRSAIGDPQSLPEGALRLSPSVARSGCKFTRSSSSQIARVSLTSGEGRHSIRRSEWSWY